MFTYEAIRDPLIWARVQLAQAVVPPMGKEDIPGLNDPKSKKEKQIKRSNSCNS